MHTVKSCKVHHGAIIILALSTLVYRLTAPKNLELGGWCYHY